MALKFHCFKQDTTSINVAYLAVTPLTGGPVTRNALKKHWKPHRSMKSRHLYKVKYLTIRYSNVFKSDIIQISLTEEHKKLFFFCREKVYFYIVFWISSFSLIRNYLSIWYWECYCFWQDSTLKKVSRNSQIIQDFFLSYNVIWTSHRVWLSCAFITRFTWKKTNFVKSI